MTADLESSRTSLHALAEHVLCAARYAATGRIGLEVIPRGFATPAFGDRPTSVAVEGIEVVVRRGGATPDERRAPITTLRAAAALAGIEPGAPAAVYRPTTPNEPDAPLEVDPGWAERLAAWRSLGDTALRRFSIEVAQDAPSPITLWPEHFDVAIRAREINYGASQGDGNVPQPYVYVGVAQIPEGDDRAFWNQPFGATLPWDQVRTVEDAVSFFHVGRRAATR